jgi:hypothetical protein
VKSLILSLGFELGVALGSWSFERDEIKFKLIRNFEYPTQAANENGYRSRCGCLVQIRQTCIFRVWEMKEKKNQSTK